MNTTVQKRSFFSYAILNAITFGIYGVVVRSQINSDIETICAGDGQQAQHSFGQAWIISKLYNLMAIGIVGLPLSVAAGIAAYVTHFPINGFLSFILVLALVIALAFMLEGPYLSSWWYTQHNRLVLNSHRYRMVLNDNAFDTAVWKSLMYFPMNLFSLLGYLVCIAGFVLFVITCMNDFLFSKVSYGVLCLFGGYFLGAIFLFVKNIINLPLYYTIKSVNRFSENMGITYAGPYEPTGLLDEDNKDNIFSRLINVLENFGKADKVKKAPFDDEGPTVLGNDDTPVGGGVIPPERIPRVDPTDAVASGSIECLAGTNKGYVYNIGDGEELIIGKDPKTASIVISPEYRDVSRKHCGIKYSAANSCYFVTDYSSNGTKLNGTKLTPGQPEKVKRGSQIALGKGDNIFKVK